MPVTARGARSTVGCVVGLVSFAIVMIAMIAGLIANLTGGHGHR